MADHDTKFSRSSTELLLKLERERRQRQRRERLRRFMEESRLGWLVHPDPFDTYHQTLPLPTKLEAARARFMRRFSWFVLLRKRSERIYQLGLGGIVIAPLAAWIVLHSNSVFARAFPLQLGFLYFSGLAYVLACAWVAWRCPDLIREVSERQANYDPDRKLHWRALIEEEIHALVSVRAYPIELAFDDFQPSENSRRARQLFLGGIEPHQSGFGSFGCYRLEEAIITCAHERGLAVYEESRTCPPFLSRIEGPRKLIEAREPYVVSLSIRQASEKEEEFHRESKTKQSLAGKPLSSESKGVPPGSIIINWHSSGFEFKSEAFSDAPLAVRHVHGLHTLYEVIDVERLAETVASWQGRQNLLSRLFASGLYLIALLAFGVFLTMQSWIVVQAVRGAI
ncbi:hypothetical protein CSC67_05235 [Pusillimonas caeni]|uniref:hypothetical protein n=1 Tax=Pusillimonas caeni TaxID=1348472 RepID=UPI0010754C94|nr:hypothetical protein [Pusillimonas caeni]TFL14755.1 hypothetical protein CSC67_05235 [Pusillimonas caeni]